MQNLGTMKRTIFFTLLFISLVLGFSISKAQDPNFSQHFNAPIYYNPAYTGLTTGLRARFLYRDQWPSLPVDYKAYHF